MLIISLVGCLCFLNKSIAQFTTYGVDFYTGAFLFSYENELIVTTLSTVQVQFTIETGTGWNYTGNVSVDNPAIVELPYYTAVYYGQYSQRYKGIHVFCNVPISVVIMFQRYLTYNAEFLAYPYINFAIEQYKYYIASIDSCYRSNSQFLLVGNEDNTTITIVPTQMIEVPEDPQYFDSSTITVRAGETYTFLLHTMETFLIESIDDLSGTAVVSNNPLTVISGHEKGIEPQDQPWVDILTNHPLNKGVHCTSVAEQIPPTVTWGKQFLFVPFPDIPYVIKIIASEGETTVKQTCNGTLDQIIFFAFNGEWNLTYFENNSQVYCAIESDKPILVLQLVSEGQGRDLSLDTIYKYIHLTLNILPPVEQYINAVTIVPLQTSNYDYYDHHYIHITTTNTTSILLDNKTYDWNWQSIHSDNGDIIGYGTVHEFDDNLPHVLRHTDVSAGFSVIVYGSYFDDVFWYHYNYGYDFFYEGYTYLAGMKLSNINTS